MKLLILLGVIACVSGQDLCPPGSEFWPHEDCHFFYVCDNGVPTVEECPGDLYWNQEASTCDFQANVPICQGGTRPPIGSTAAPTTTTGVVTSDGTTKLPPGVCPPEGVHQIAHEERCDAYYFCIDGVRQEPYHVCPENLYFDPSIGECNFAADVDCPGVTSTGSTSPPLTSTNPPSTVTTTPTTTNPGQTSTNRPDLPECPDSGSSQLPYPGDCTLYVQCIEGFSIIFRCPDGELFDTAERTCKLAEVAVCTVRHSIQ